MNGMLFEKSESVAALNHVEGFNPKEYARVIQKEGQQDQLYLDVAIRKLWFRLKYPLGKIRKSIVTLNENMAVMEARIYLDVNDPEDKYIASGFSQKFRSSDEQFGDKFFEMAETAAVGRALADAGFGIQFADVSGEQDPNQVDAGLPTQGYGAPLQDARGFPTQMNQNTADMGQPAMPEQQMLPQQQYQQGYPYQNQAYGMPQTQQVYQQQAQQQHQFDRNQPAEVLYGQLTYEQALAVPAPGNGKLGGMPLGRIAMEQPDSLKFFVDGYKGPDNLVRAAAKLILDKAAQAA